ncbi:MAG: glutamate-5-semialdehyde dehydrogenase [Thermoproteota archaeon]|nr:glutamate-5-semialdehyde dehydrogenase [Candidatus Brockarchaeota archaeon]
MSLDSVYEEVLLKAKKAKEASKLLAAVNSETKNKALRSAATAIIENKEYILKENEKDVKMLRMTLGEVPLIDRLLLNQERLGEMANSLVELSNLPDPVGEVIEGWTTRHGLEILKVRVPFGVIGIIYEARPNVTSDVAGIAIKSGNAVVLKGGQEAINSNIAIVKVMRKAISDFLPEESIQIIENTSREAVKAMLGLQDYIDIIVPRGSANFIRYVRENSKIPVIETGAGNNHIFVNYDADFDMAIKIIINAKVQRPTVCNAVRKVLVHNKIARSFIPLLVKSLEKYKVRIKGCPKTIEIAQDIEEAKEEDWYEEYMDLTLAIKVVDSMEEAIEHINKYGTKHSEAIITSNIEDAKLFTKLVDASTVYVNASTRFTDGNQFGFGAEVGISTQKLHARGPMGLRELTTTKYVVYGNGQIRD